MSEHNRIIFGLGNYAKDDDGIGLRIVEHIVDNDLDDGFAAIELGNDGLHILNYFNEDVEKILIVDCALLDKEPGEYMIFDFEDVETKKQVGNISTHEGDIMKLVALGKELDSQIPKIRIMAIQPDSLEMDMTLSECLESKLETYVNAAIEEIKK